MENLIYLFGFAGFIAVCATAVTGVYLKKLHLKMIHHKVIAIITLLFASVHLMIILAEKYFIK